jgi:hypothetical protein
LLLFSHGPRGRDGLKLLDKIAREYALLLGAGLVDVDAAVPVGVIIVRDSNDLPGGEVEVVLVRRRVFVERLDAEQGGHCGGVSSRNNLVVAGCRGLARPEALYSC